MDQATAVGRLREKLPRGITVYTMRVNHGDRTQRKHYAFLRIYDTEKGDRAIENYTFLVAHAIGMPRHPVNGGIMTTDDAHGLVALLAIRLYDDHKALEPCRLD